jgi:hypothetical protein
MAKESSFEMQRNSLNQIPRLFLKESGMVHESLLKILA